MHALVNEQEVVLNALGDAHDAAWQPLAPALEMDLLRRPGAPLAPDDEQPECVQGVNDGSDQSTHAAQSVDGKQPVMERGVP